MTKYIKFTLAISLVVFSANLGRAFETPPTPATPRIDLYQKIKGETGLSLKDVSQALLEGNKSKQDSLRTLNKKIGTAGVEKTFADQIARVKESCVKKRTEKSCAIEVKSIESERDEFMKLFKDVMAKPDNKDSKSLSVATSLFFNEMRERVLWPAIGEWDKTCPESKANEATCREIAIGLGHLEEIGRDLSIVAAMNADSKKPEAEFVEGLKKRVAVYAEK